MAFGLDALFTTFVKCYLEYLSMAILKFCSIHISNRIGLPKSIYISTFAYLHLVVSHHLLCGTNDFKFLSKLVHAVHSLAFASISRKIHGQQVFFANESIAKLPGWVECKPSTTASIMDLGIAILDRDIHTWHSCPSNMSVYWTALFDTGFVVAQHTVPDFFQNMVLL